MEKSIKPSKKEVIVRGMRDGLPIGLGYFAVAFSLGIAAKNAGISPLQSLIMSLLCNASAGEYAGITLIAAGATYIETAVMILIANARYLLMSCAMSQKFRPGEKLFHRLLIGFDITDELFAIAMAQPGYLNPFYYYGAMMMAMPCWAVGTAMGTIAGNILPLRVVSALSVALYGMFLAVIIPPAKKDKVVAGVIVVSFALSYLASVISFTAAISEGMRTIILTILISSAAAVFFPKKQDEEDLK